MKRAKYNIVAILIFIVYAAFLAITNMSLVKVNVAAVEGSYAYNFAKENHLNVAKITDDMKKDLDVRYEGDEVEVVKVNQSDAKGNYMEVTKGDIVLRIYDDGSITNGIEELTVSAETPSMNSADEIYIIQNGDTLTEIAIKEGSDIYEIAELNGIENINLIYAGVELQIPTKESLDKQIEVMEKTNAVVEEFNYIVSPLSECEYGYNVVNDTIEIVYYYGNDSVLVIPSYIDGKPVKKLSMDFAGEYDTIIVPETVAAITGKVTDVLYVPMFVIELAFSIIAFIIVIISANVLFSRFRNKEEYLLTGSQIVLSTLYIVAQFVFSILSIYGFVYIGLGGAFVVSLAMFVVYVLFVTMAGAGRSHAIKDSRETTQKSAVMKNLKLQTAGLSALVEDVELKSELDKLSEAFRFSPNESSEDTYDVESKLMEEVKNLLNQIETNDKEGILSSCKTINMHLATRNKIAKSN